MPEAIKRHYSGLGDSAMLNGTQTMRNLFQSDLAEFTAFDAQFIAAYSNNWLQKINLGIAEPSDEVIVDQIMEKTQEVAASATACRNNYQDLKYFIEKAYPNNPARQRVFGADDYQDTVSTMDMIKFMDNLFKKATLFTVDLTAVACPPALITAAETLGNQLNTDNQEQETLIAERPEDTQDRIIIMNNGWDPGVLVSKASKRMFRNNPAKYHQYLLPGPGTNESPADLSIMGTIRNQVTSAILNNVPVHMDPDNLDANSDLQGKYAFGLVPNGDKVLTVNFPGYEPFNMPMTYSGTTLVVDILLVPMP